MSRRKREPKHQKAKGIFAVFLAIAFLTTLWIQFGPSGEVAPVPSIKTGFVQKKSPTRILEKPSDSIPKRVVEVELPSMDVEQIALANPFMDTTPRVERLAPIVAVEFESKIDLIYRNQDGFVALIDEQIVRPGDLLSNGFRVTDIQPNGIKVIRE